MISILIPVYNGIEFIQECISSVKNQSFTDWEVIIGINGHPPKSLVYLIAKQFASDKIHVYDLPEYNNKCDTMNRLITLAKYDWIATLDVDDIWLPNKLLHQVHFMDKYDVIGTNMKYFGDWNHTTKIPLGDISKFDFISVNPVVSSSALIKKELCQWFYKPYATYSILIDYSLWLKLWKQGRKFYNVPSIEVLHRIHSTSAHNTKNTNKEVLALRNLFR